MSKIAHTPGPWDYVGRLGYGHLIGPNIAVAYGGELSGRKCHGKANAHLIAAAPEMYEALQEARLQVEILQGRLGIKDTGAGTLSIIDAALAKATGGEQ